MERKEIDEKLDKMAGMEVASTGDLTKPKESDTEEVSNCEEYWDPTISKK